jgi:SNF2 family DNA or RNA helicase
MRGRALLADEVGLGKTIEAGIVMKELIQRGLVRTVLVLTPASLTEQWREELLTKFGENSPC